MSTSISEKTHTQKSVNLKIEKKSKNNQIIVVYFI